MSRQGDRAGRSGERTRRSPRSKFTSLILVGVLAVETTGLVAGRNADTPTKAAKVPPTLPSGVRAKQTSAVKIEYSSSPKNDWEGSGVKIGKRLVLSAGHMVLKGNPFDRIKCAGSYAIDRYSTPSREDQITSWSALDDSHNYTEGEDLSVLRIRRDANFDRLPVAHLATSSPTTGETVFFVNYEGGPAAHEDRFPNASEARHYVGKIYGHVAEYAGTVIGNQGPYLVTATGQKDYNPSSGQAENSYPGASGGPVFNRRGEVVAVDVAGSDGETVADIAKNYGVQLHLPLKDFVGIELLQPTAPAIVHSLVETLPKDSVC